MKLYPFAALTALVATVVISGRTEARYSADPGIVSPSTGCPVPSNERYRVQMSPSEFYRSAKFIGTGDSFGSSREVKDTTIFGKAFMYGIGELNKGNYRNAQRLFQRAIDYSYPQQTYDYDSDGQIDAMSSAGSNIAAKIAYDAAEAGVRVWQTMKGRPGTKEAANACVRLNLGAGLSSVFD